MDFPRGLPFRLPPNRVWRTYTGGRTLDAIAGVAGPRDDHFPEDWIGSVTRATNIGREAITEGLSIVEAVEARVQLRDLLDADPTYLLGAAHVARYGADPRLLVKLLDPAIRLHIQVHPTAAFAQRFLGTPSGKSEAYHILGTRDGEPGYVYLGFQRPPSRTALRHMIEAQDITALESCFDPIPVRPGDTLVVPGGTPHALGENVLLVEIQEPTDLVVRCEFARGGYVLPEAARFMNRGLEFCLDIFDLTPRSVVDVLNNLRIRPRPTQTSAGCLHEVLIDHAQTPCFRVDRLQLTASTTWTVDAFTIGLVLHGELTLGTASTSTHYTTHQAFLLPAGLREIALHPQPGATVLLCRPPAA